MCDGVRENADPAAAVLHAAERLRPHPAQPRDGAASRARLLTLTRARDLLNLEIAREADAFGASGQWEAEGSTSPQDWLRHQCRMSTPDAYTAVTVGAQVATLQQSVAAVDAGRIGFAHLDLMARTAAAVERSSGGSRSLDEHLLLQLAEAHSVGRFHYDCYHARHAEDPQGALQEQVDAVERRYLEFSTQRDQLVRVSGLLDTVGYAAVRTQLEPLARRNGAEDRRVRSRRLADAWVESAVHVLDQGTLPQHGSQRPHVQVTATLETLLGAAGAPGGEMEYAGPLTAATVRRLACDARLVRVLLDAESAVVDVGRARRTAPPATLRALRIRDGGCVWPGCERPATWCTAHHAVEWVKDKGGTNVATMVLLCYRHHWLVHEGGWQIARTDEGVIVVPPLGGYVPGHAPDARPRRVVLDDWQSAHDEVHPPPPGGDVPVAGDVVGDVLDG